MCLPEAMWRNMLFCFWYYKSFDTNKSPPVAKRKEIGLDARSAVAAEEIPMREDPHTQYCTCRACPAPRMHLLFALFLIYDQHRLVACWVACSYTRAS